MNRLILVSQFPNKLRYPSWWITEFPKNLKPYFNDIIVLGKDYSVDQTKVNNYSDIFSPVDLSIDFELKQIQEFMDININDNDTLLLCDLSFPGFFTNMLFHKPVKNSYAICHATSMNYLDYFEKVRDTKFFNEISCAKVYKTIFMATNYHKNKIGFNNTIVTALPNSPFPRFKLEKNKDLISVARITPQKVNLDLEIEIENKFGKIIRSNFNNWNDYYKFVSESKILIITSFEETFGYQVLDAINNNCIPLAPNRCSYPELLPKDYLYDNEEELFNKIEMVLNNNLKVPELINKELIDNFYNNISSIMNKNKFI